MLCRHIDKSVDVRPQRFSGRLQRIFMFRPMKPNLTFIVTTAILSLILSGSSNACGKTMSSNIRPPAVAGQFYPSDPVKLKSAIQQFLDDSVSIPMEKPIAIVVPHAGYIYSGQICADAFRQVMGYNYDLVVILGTNHTSGNLHGISVYPHGAYRTPLGDVLIDEEVTTALLAENRECIEDLEAHVKEHSIEVQIPFIQFLFPDAKIVPLVIHPPDINMCTRFGQSLAKVLKNRQALIVISSDLSHYPAYEDAVKVDHQTLRSMVRLDPKEFDSTTRTLLAQNVPDLATTACGKAPILAGLVAAKALGATRAVIAGYANSGDVSLGNQAGVVGYGAVVLTTGEGSSDVRALSRPAAAATATPLQALEKKTLLAFARKTIVRYLITNTIPLARDFPPRLNYHQGAFVTLKKGGQLRGCIGHIPADCELGKIVGAMAIKAAFADLRFGPLEFEELKDIEIEISVLTPMKPIADANEIKLGRDGVVLNKEGKTAVFLPQVAIENNFTRTEFLDQLCIKAGLPPGSWKRDTQLYIFQAEVFSESEFN